jgi:hypothetical protein
MKRFLLLGSLALVGCVEDPRPPPVPSVPPSVVESQDSGNVRLYSLEASIVVRDWQHPVTRCWYLIGPSSGRALLELRDASGNQVCGSFPTGLGSVAAVSK